MSINRRSAQSSYELLLTLTNATKRCFSQLIGADQALHAVKLSVGLDADDIAAGWPRSHSVGLLFAGNLVFIAETEAEGLYRR